MMSVGVGRAAKSWQGKVSEAVATSFGGCKTLWTPVSLLQKNSAPHVKRGATSTFQNTLIAISR